jgi:hypothetical protein
MTHESRFRSNPADGKSDAAAQKTDAKNRDSSRPIICGGMGHEN